MYVVTHTMGHRKDYHRTVNLPPRSQCLLYPDAGVGISAGELEQHLASARRWTLLPAARSVRCSQQGTNPLLFIVQGHVLALHISKALSMHRWPQNILVSSACPTGLHNPVAW
jgi:hypothetical protein